jgi:signal recognition particle GTPase
MGAAGEFAVAGMLDTSSCSPGWPKNTGAPAVQPVLFVVAGPNGAGKTTVTARLKRDVIL